jgi:hypothetical protein
LLGAENNRGISRRRPVLKITRDVLIRYENSLLDSSTIYKIAVMTGSDLGGRDLRIELSRINHNTSVGS